MPKTNHKTRASTITELRATHSAASKSKTPRPAHASSKQAQASSKRMAALRDRLKKKFKTDVLTTLAGGSRVDNISAMPSGWSEVDDLVTGETDLAGRTLTGTGLGWPRGRIVEIYGEEGVGKALEVSTPVLTPDGFVPIGTLKRGDHVIGADGRPTRVLGVFPQGTKKAFEVTTSDGGSIVCCAEHLWATAMENESSPKVRTTAEIATTVSRSSGDFEMLRHRLPVCAPVLFRAQHDPLPLDPYLLGCLLGDGGLASGSITIHKPEPDVLERCRERLPDGDVGVLFDDGNGPASALRIKRAERDGSRSETAKALDAVDLFGVRSIDKFIPPAYLYAAIESRMMLLRGLNDTDGHVRGRGHDVEFGTSSEQLAADVIFLARSLGAVVTTTVRFPTYTYKGVRKRGRLAYRITIRFTDARRPVSSDKHMSRWRGGDETPFYRKIRSVEPVGEAEFVCIKVDAEDGLFVVDDFIVTHNTTLACHIVAAFQRSGEEAAYVDAEHALDVTYASKLTVDMTRLQFAQPDSAEEALQVTQELCDSGAFGVVVVDSVAALTPEAELEGDMGDYHVGLHARLMSQAMRKLKGIVARRNVLLVFINQTRMKIGVRYGNPKTTTGGNALKFYASVRLELVNVKTLKKGTRVTGRRIRVRSVKNKVAPPFRDLFCDFEPNVGIARVHGDPDLDGDDAGD